MASQAASAPKQLADDRFPLGFLGTGVDSLVPS